MHRLEMLACVAIGLAVLSGTAGAVSVDGVLDPEYGIALSTQTTQTSLGDQPNNFLNGSELDEAFGYVAGNTLYLLLTGSYNRYEGEVYYAELPEGGGGAGSFLGSTAIGGPGTLSGVGANNPFGILASIDVSNSAGVTAGCDAASGAGVTTGIEWAIPLAAIGNPTGTIRICALLAKAGLSSGEVSNQVLGPLPPGTCSLGPAAGVDFGNVPGLQYFLINPATPVMRSSWGRLKAAYR